MKFFSKMNWIFQWNFQFFSGSANYDLLSDKKEKYQRKNCRSNYRGENPDSNFKSVCFVIIFFDQGSRSRFI